MSKRAFFWFRRDLRWHDNAGLYHALRENDSVRLVFIFDSTILSKLKDKNDLRVLFIHRTLRALKKQISDLGGDLEVYLGDPQKLWRQLLKTNPEDSLYFNHDYEPAARDRDQKIADLCERLGKNCFTYKDQVIFEKDEVLTAMNKPYSVFTPYKKKWLQALSPFYLKPYPVEKYQQHLAKVSKPQHLLRLTEIGFHDSAFEFPECEVPSSLLKNYGADRDFPSKLGTSRLGMHLRFGTVSVRALVKLAKDTSAVWLSELIWREFFMQIVYHFPHVVSGSFRPEYDKIAWRKSPADLQKWKDGLTGYPLVDAGMRELRQTGFMHNRVRMITASFLTKHLLIHWSEGEKYFAEKLLDYELSSNNGNWQWAAGSGCDAAPYFRVFNPETQRQRFDKSEEYIRKWVPEFGTEKYPEPMVDHVFARVRALREYGKGLEKSTS